MNLAKYVKKKCLCLFVSTLKLKVYSKGTRQCWTRKDSQWLNVYMYLF